MSRSVDEIHKEILNNVSDTYEKTVGYPMYDITRTVALLGATFEEKVDELYKHLDPNNLSGEELNEFTSQHKGISRKEATKAIGVLEVTGTCEIEYGDLFETINGVQFYAIQNYFIIDYGYIDVKAVIPGAAGNVGANSITLIPISIPGLLSVNNISPTYDGYDAESDDSLLSRYLYALQNPITSNNKAHYKQWALEVSGVGNAKVAPLENGDNTVSVYIVDSEMKPANAELVARVQEYIDPGASGEGNGQSTIGAYCTVKSAIERSLNISVSITIITGYDLEIVQSNIKTAIDKYLKSINFVTTNISFAHLGSTILNAEGVIDYTNLTLNGGTENLILGEFESAVAYITYE